MKGEIFIKDKVNTEIIVKSVINRNELDKYHYTNSLINKAVNLQLLEMSDLANIQNQLMRCLSDLIMQKTNGDSTSLPVDETKDLTNSMMYTLDVYLETIPNPDDALLELKTQKIQDLIKKGTDIVSQMYDEVKELYFYIIKKRLTISLDCYNTTIEEAMPIFLKSYNIVFGAHITSTTIDYPLAIDDWDVCGVKYMLIYMKRIILETNFCKLFKQETVEQLLNCFGKKIRMDYKLELLNMFELVYHNAVYKILAGGKVNELILSQEEGDNVIHMLGTLDKDKILMVIQNATNTLFDVLKITDEVTKEYIFSYLPSFVQRLDNARQNHSLDSMVIIRTEEKVKERFSLFQSGVSMDDKDFMKLIDAINSIDDAADKASYIIANVTSLYDFIDILKSDYLYGEEYDAIYHKLGEFELAILVKIVYYEALREQKDSLYEIINSQGVNDEEWQYGFKEFIIGQEYKFIVNIEAYLDEIEYEQIKFN